MAKEYRLFYGPDGNIIRGTKIDSAHVDTEPYVVVEQHVYKEQNYYKVINGMLVKNEPQRHTAYRLRKSKQGHRVVKNHAGLLLFDNESYLEVEYYDYRNN